MGQVDGHGHVVLRLVGGVAEHHSLVAGSLVFRVLAHHAAVDVLALLVDFGKDSARVAIEHIFGLVVADAVDHAAHNLLDVNVRLVRAHLAADYHQTRRAECLAGHF